MTFSLYCEYGDPAFHTDIFQSIHFIYVEHIIDSRCHPHKCEIVCQRPPSVYCIMRGLIDKTVKIHVYWILVVYLSAKNSCEPRILSSRLNLSGKKSLLFLVLLLLVPSIEPITDNPWPFRRRSSCLDGSDECVRDNI